MKQILIIILFLILSLVSISGFGAIINFNQFVLYLIGAAIIIYIYRRHQNTLSLGQFSVIISIVCIIEFLNIYFNWITPVQLLNYCTLFGLVIGINLLSQIKWEHISFFKGGLLLWTFSWITIQLFLPDRALSGWNPNSPILIIPAIFCALGLILYSSSNFKLIIFYGVAFISLLSILELENRSALISLIVFTILPLPILNNIYKKKIWFRIFYILIIFLNIAFPLFSDLIGNYEWYNDLVGFSQEYIEKQGGFSGRDKLWNIGLLQLYQSPLLGYAGTRSIYLHNFSIDVLTQFGWLGWGTFILMVIIILEKVFKENSNSNIFLAGFLCLWIVNTFENAFLADNAFTILPYILLAIAWRLKLHTQKEGMENNREEETQEREVIQEV